MMDLERLNDLAQEAGLKYVTEQGLSNALRNALRDRVKLLFSLTEASTRDEDYQLYGRDLTNLNDELIAILDALGVDV